MARYLGFVCALWVLCLALALVPRLEADCSRLSDRTDYWSGQFHPSDRPEVWGYCVWGR